MGFCFNFRSGPLHPYVTIEGQGYAYLGTISNGGRVAATKDVYLYNGDTLQRVPKNLLRPYEFVGYAQVLALATDNVAGYAADKSA